MSLSFVSSAVLSSTDGVSHNEEKSIESKEVKALRTKQEHKPLFEQLRNNREEEEAAKEEFQRTIMRGTRALDEEDCAHLDAIQREKEKREHAVKSQEDEELALFRAAKADRTQADIVVDDEGDGPLDNKQTQPQLDKKMPATKPKKSLVPVITKKRRRRPADGQELPKKLKPAEDTEKTDKDSTAHTVTTKEESSGGLGGLLGGYSSSDDSD